MRTVTLICSIALAAGCGTGAPVDEVGTESSAAASTCGWLRSGELLWPGESVQSCNGRAELKHKGTGNVVERDEAGALWSTGTEGYNTHALVMQTDGNLVLYKPNGVALWHTGTHGNPGAALAIQDDCNLVIYSTTGQVLWASYKLCRHAPPAAPTSLAATADFDGTSIRFYWQDNSNNEAGFKIYNGVSYVTVPADTTFYSWGGLSPNTYMCFAVFAYNGSGSSSWSEYKCTTTPNSPAAPTNVTATAIDGTRIRVTWTDNSNNEDKFAIQNGDVSVAVGPNITSYTWNGLSPGTRYCFKVAAQNSSGSSRWTPEACATTP